MLLHSLVNLLRLLTASDDRLIKLIRLLTLSLLFLENMKVARCLARQEILFCFYLGNEFSLIKFNKFVIVILRLGY